jgi:hypothetical protein
MHAVITRGVNARVQYMYKGSNKVGEWPKIRWAWRDCFLIPAVAHLHGTLCMECEATLDLHNGCVILSDTLKVREDWMIIAHLSPSLHSLLLAVVWCWCAQVSGLSGPRTWSARSDPRSLHLGASAMVLPGGSDSEDEEWLCCVSRLCWQLAVDCVMYVVHSMKAHDAYHKYCVQPTSPQRKGCKS